MGRFSFGTKTAHPESVQDAPQMTHSMWGACVSGPQAGKRG